MLTMVIGLGAGVLYWLSLYKLAFWILVYTIVYGGLGVLRGDNQLRWAFRGDAGLTTLLLVPAAWHIGRLAGYF